MADIYVPVAEWSSETFAKAALERDKSLNPIVVLTKNDDKTTGYVICVKSTMDL